MTESDLERRLDSARRAGPGWNAGRQQQVKWALMSRLDQPRRRSPFFVLAIGCAATAMIGVVGWRTLASRGTEVTRRTGSTGLPAPLAASGTERPLPKLADGSSIVLDGPSAILKKTVETADEVAFQLEAGGAHFEVAPRPSRVFRVHAGPVTVQVIGTRFHVQRQKNRSHITVDRGRVLVSWWGGSRELTAGEEGIFPPTDETPKASAPLGIPFSPRVSSGWHAPGASRGSSASHAASASRTPPVSHVPPGSPVEPAAKPTAAVTGPMPERSGSPSGPEALFQRADRARTEGRSDAAIVNLREIVERYPGDPHAPVAAFTMGRLLLETQGKSRQAAQAFGQARALAHGGPLVEDALAREVEALHMTGDSSAARQRAELYVQLFPSGPRLRTVMRFGGLRADP